jgi:hypothetical protein
MASFFAQIRRKCSYWRILRSIVRGPDASDRGLLPRYGAPGYISPQANLPCRHDWLCGADRAHMDLQVGGVFMEQPSRNPRDKERVDVGRGPEYLAHEIGDLLKLEKAAPTKMGDCFRRLCFEASQTLSCDGPRGYGSSPLRSLP